MKWKQTLAGIGLLVAAAAVSHSCASPGDRVGASRDHIHGSPPPARRVAAEWEPAVGVLVSWPPYLPRELFSEIAKNSHLFVVVADDEMQANARQWFDRWDIDESSVTFLTVPGSDDQAWTRDYGPHAVFDEASRLLLIDARYDKSTPDSGLACDAPLLTPWNGGWGDRFKDYDVTQEDAAPTRIAEQLSMPSLPFAGVLTGGNFMTDGRGLALSTCIITNENRSNGLADRKFFALAEKELGINAYHIISNFEDKGIQHIDCLLKMLDDNRLLVARPPRNHPLHDRYERIVREDLAKLRTSCGEPFEILRIDTAEYEESYPEHALAAYTNSLILNDVVYVPLFDIPQDDIALAQWQEALPGHTIKGIRFRLDDEPALPDRARRMYEGKLGWRSFDALHCRTRAVWDPNMLHIAVDPPRPGSDGQGWWIMADIIAYSGASLIADKLQLYWRVEGESDWHSTPLRRTRAGRFRAYFPAALPGSVVEYYLHAVDEKGRAETAPRTAPRAFYKTSFE